MTIKSPATSAPESGHNGLSFFDEFKIKLNICTFYIRVDNFAAALVKIIEIGEGGVFWVPERDEPPFSIPDPESYEKFKKPIS